VGREDDRKRDRQTDRVRKRGREEEERERREESEINSHCFLCLFSLWLLSRTIYLTLLI
jgi:hypothetical protein